jgi:hypothetical protein
MLLKAGPPSFVTEFDPWKRRLIGEGAWLRARLPAYLAQRRALLDAHCPLLATLRAIVAGYQEPTYHHRGALGYGAWLGSRINPPGPLCNITVRPPWILSLSRKVRRQHNNNILKRGYCWREAYCGDTMQSTCAPTLPSASLFGLLINMHQLRDSKLNYDSY